MELWRFIEHDHANIEELFTELLVTGVGGAVVREKVFRELQKQLEAHTEMEENAFYPALTKHGHAGHFLPEAVDAHERAQLLLTELDGMSVGSELWIETLRKLRQVVRDHVQKEETEIIPAAQRVIGGHYAEQTLLRRMIKEKRRFLVGSV